MSTSPHRRAALEGRRRDKEMSWRSGRLPPPSCASGRTISAAVHYSPPSRRTRARRAQVIIDCHGHYTTAPKALEEWRNRQIAGIKDPSARPRVSELAMSDDDIRQTIE